MMPLLHGHYLTHVVYFSLMVGDKLIDEGRAKACDLVILFGIHIDSKPDCLLARTANSVTIILLSFSLGIIMEKMF